MDIVRYNEPAQDAEPETKGGIRPPFAKLTDNKRVKLRLSGAAFMEACRWVGDMTPLLGQQAQEHPWLDLESVRERATLSLLLDVYEQQMLPFALRQPELVTLSLSRCEAHLFWEIWSIWELPASEVPFLAEVMNELHHLLT